MLVQTPRQVEEDPELERLINQARLTTTAQFYDKDEKARLTEIRPTGLPTNAVKPKTKKRERPKIEPIVEDIPPWSKKSLTQYAGKVKEMLTLLQQGKEEAKIFVGNNTKERNGKEMVTGMLQEHLQKIVNVSLKRTPSQATELLDTEPQNLQTKEQQEAAEEGPTVNHTEEVKGKRYQAMPKVDVLTIREKKINLGMMREILVHTNIRHEGISLISPVWDLDNRCMYPRAISLKTTRPLQEKVEGPITEKQRQRNKNRQRYATYAIYNTSHEVITLPKNQIEG